MRSPASGCAAARGDAPPEHHRRLAGGWRRRRGIAQRDRGDRARPSAATAARGRRARPRGAGWAPRRRRSGGRRARPRRTPGARRPRAWRCSTPTRQWAAVSTTRGATSVPPQNVVFLPSSCSSSCVIQGQLVIGSTSRPRRRAPVRRGRPARRARIATARMGARRRMWSDGACHAARTLGTRVAKGRRPDRSWSSPRSSAHTPRWRWSRPRASSRSGRSGFDVDPGHRGALDIYAPLVDWGVRFGGVRLPVRLKVDVRAVDRASVFRVAQAGNLDVTAVREEATTARAQLPHHPARGDARRRLRARRARRPGRAAVLAAATSRDAAGRRGHRADRRRWSSRSCSRPR